MPGHYCEACPIIIRMREEDRLAKLALKGRIDPSLMFAGVPWIPAWNMDSLSGKIVYQPYAPHFSYVCV